MEGSAELTGASMTEKQWLKSANAEAMNSFYNKRHTERKARLLMLACCQRHPEHLQQPPIRAMVELLVAHYADPRKPDKPLRGRNLHAQYRALERFASSTPTSPDRGVAFGMVAAAEPVSTMKRLDEDFEYLVFSCLHDIAFAVDEGRNKKESKLQAALMREVFGNPFRPVACEPAWLTDNVVLLARQMYETEDFSPMPILADALQEAGCEHADVLTHCRDAKQVHVRGCWVLDLIFDGVIAREAKAKGKRLAARKRKGDA